MSAFSDHLSRASEKFLEIAGERVSVDGNEMDGDIDPVTFAEFVRLGGRSPGHEFICFVRKTDFLKHGGKKGSNIEARGYEARVKRLSDVDDGQLELICEPFSYGNIRL